MCLSLTALLEPRPIKRFTGMSSDRPEEVEISSMIASGRPSALHAYFVLVDEFCQFSTTLAFSVGKVIARAHLVDGRNGELAEVNQFLTGKKAGGSLRIDERIAENQRSSRNDLPPDLAPPSCFWFVF